MSTDRTYWTAELESSQYRLLDKVFLRENNAEAMRAMVQEKDIKFRPLVLQEDEVIPRGACRAIRYEQSKPLKTAFEDVGGKQNEMDLSTFETGDRVDDQGFSRMDQVKRFDTYAGVGLQRSDEPIERRAQS